MPTLTVTVAGLIAVVIKEKSLEAAAVLVKHPKHQHHPMLLIPRECISDDSAIEKLSLKDPSPRLTGARLPRDVADYAAYDVTGYNLDLTSEPATPVLVLITDPPPPRSGCPQDDNWDSIDWLLNLNIASKKKTFSLKKEALRRRQLAPAIAALLGVGHGRLAGHAPVEKSSKTHKLSYDTMDARAYTDAALWSATVKNDIAISFTDRSTLEPLGTLRLKTDRVDALLVNLPDPKMPGTLGGHIDAYRNLPFDEETPVGAVVVEGACDAGGASMARGTSGSGAAGLTVTVTTSGPPPVELSVSATARYADNKVVESHAHHGTDHDLETRGDSLCMGLVIHVESL